MKRAGVLLALDEERAIAALPKLLPETQDRARLEALLERLAARDGPANAARRRDAGRP